MGRGDEKSALERIIMPKMTTSPWEGTKMKTPMEDQAGSTKKKAKKPAWMMILTSRISSRTSMMRHSPISH